jgi:hypothetical protein
MQDVLKTKAFLVGSFWEALGPFSSAAARPDLLAYCQ